MNANQAPSGTQPGVIMLDADRIVFGIPVFLPTDHDSELYSIGEVIAQTCWPNATYLYAEYLP